MYSCRGMAAGSEAHKGGRKGRWGAGAEGPRLSGIIVDLRILLAAINRSITVSASYHQLGNSVPDFVAAGSPRTGDVAAIAATGWLTKSAGGATIKYSRRLLPVHVLAEAARAFYRTDALYIPAARLHAWFRFARGVELLRGRSAHLHTWGGDGKLIPAGLRLFGRTSGGHADSVRSEATRRQGGTATTNTGCKPAPQKEPPPAISRCHTLNSGD